MFKVLIMVAILITTTIAITPVLSSSSTSVSPQALAQSNATQEAKSVGNLTAPFLNSWPNIHANVKTDFNTNITVPVIQETAFIHPFAILIGSCYIGKFVLVAPTAVCRGDEGTPIYVGDYSNIQDGVIMHGLETTEKSNNIDGRRYSTTGDKLMANSSQYGDGYSVFVGTNTSLAHDSMIHGPAWVGNNTFVGMDSIIFNAKVGNNVAIGISSTISNGVSIPDNKFVPPDSRILAQEEADALPLRVGSPYENTNEAVLHVNEQLAEGYNTQLDLVQLVEEREKQIEKGMFETGMSAPLAP